jgi:phage tail-like protein
MAIGERADPLRNFNFIVEIDGITQAGFMDCSGFGANTEITEINEGGLNTASHKLASRTRHNNLTLKWGLTTSSELYDWYRDVVNGKIVRKDGSVILLDGKGDEKARWNFYDGWPVKWDGPDLTAKGNDVAIETLEIAHQGLERVREPIAKVNLRL